MEIKMGMDVVRWRDLVSELIENNDAKELGRIVGRLRIYCDAKRRDEYVDGIWLVLDEPLRQLEEAGKNLRRLELQAASDREYARRFQHDEDRRKLSLALTGTFRLDGLEFEALCREVEGIRRISESCESERKSLNVRLQEALDRSAGLVKERDHARMRLERTEEELNAARSKTTGLESESSDWKNRIEEFESQVAVLIKESETSAAKAVASLKRVREYQDENDRLRMELDAVRNGLASSEKSSGEALSRLGGEIMSLKTDLAARTTAQSAADKRAAAARKEAEAQRVRADQLASEAEDLRRMRAAVVQVKESSLAETAIVNVVRNWKRTLGIPAAMAAKIVGIAEIGSSRADALWDELIEKKRILPGSDAFRHVVEFCESRMDLLDSVTLGIAEKHRMVMGWRPAQLGMHISSVLKLSSDIDWDSMKRAVTQKVSSYTGPTRIYPGRLEVAAVRAWVLRHQEEHPEIASR